MQACFLLSTLAGSDGDSTQETICSAMASRIAQVTGLPHKLSHDPLQREIELRVWSSIYMLDVWNTTGRNIKPTILFDPNWPWPAEERVFDSMRYGDANGNKALLDKSMTPSSSVWGHMIPLTYIKSKIHDLNCSLRELPELGSQAMQSIEELSTELSLWVAKLPPRLLENEQNIAYFASIGRGRVFVALHVGQDLELFHLR
ncbi:hypothetical protein FMEXI_11294 [Fusarium mexicanum]|uniref:Transcription factor domain-containing protein n=1 Tax=Fusarium mexicanum TaxID=751941 RepID=A0A8H5MLF5_9HYPO|nr:hypothetical protein FMEXI_11294 [Fusarium mexicanum]